MQNLKGLFSGSNEQVAEACEDFFRYRTLKDLCDEFRVSSGEAGQEFTERRTLKAGA